jgi:hypothetical protein
MARGDHIYVNRLDGLYQHHGVDCGDDSVIHYTSRTWRGQRRIERTEMEEFCRDHEPHTRDYAEFLDALSQAEEPLLRRASRRFNRMLDSLRGIDVSELDFSEKAVIDRAESRLGESNFDLFSNNCEHFAAWCKTGISGSNQIDSIWKASLTGPAFMQRQAQGLLSRALDQRWSADDNR